MLNLAKLWVCAQTLCRVLSLSGDDDRLIALTFFFSLFKAKKRRRDKDAPKKPLSPYILFSKDYR